MAMFDRRLLAYFDDAGLGSSGTTILDRVADYQKDLSEIERELCKYQHLLGSRRGKAKIRARNRDSWITAHKEKEQPSVKETYKHVAEAAKRDFESAPSGGDEKDGGVDEKDGGTKKKRQSVKPGRRESKLDRRPSVQQGRASIHQGARASVRPSVAGNAGRRQSEVDFFQKQRQSVAPAGAVIGHLWAQLDKLLGLRRGSTLGQYCLRVAVQPEPPGCVEQVTEIRDAKDAADNPDLEECQIRQQMKVAAGTDIKLLVITVIRKGRTDYDDAVVGSCRIDVWDKSSWQVQSHELFDDHGDATGAKLRLRIPEEPLIALRMQLASAGDGGGRKSLAPRASVKPRGSVAPRASVARASISGNRGVTPDDAVVAKGSVGAPRRSSVSQDPRSVPPPKRSSVIGGPPADIGRRPSQAGLSKMMTTVAEGQDEEEDEEEDEEDEEEDDEEDAEEDEEEKSATAESKSEGPDDDEDEEDEDEEEEDEEEDEDEESD